MTGTEQQVFDHYIRSSGLKETAQRKIVLDAFLKTEKHVSVRDLYFIICKRECKVGYATVHRTMKLFADCGLAREVMFDDGISRFEHLYRHRHHHHLVCTRCRKVIEFTSNLIDKEEKTILKRHGFQLQSHRYEIFGLCRECRKKAGRN